MYALLLLFGANLERTQGGYNCNRLYLQIYVALLAADQCDAIHIESK